MEYEEIMDMIVGELTQRALSRQREEDESLDQLILRQVELRASIERCLSKLDKPDRHIFQEYLDLNLEVWGFGGFRKSTYTCKGQRTVCGI